MLNSVPLDDKSVFGIARDITEQKEAENELRKNEKSFQLITENAYDFIWTIDMNMNITYASNSVTRLLGYTKEEVLNINTSKLYSKDEFDRILKIVSEELAKGAPHQGVVFNSKKYS